MATDAADQTSTISGVHHAAFRCRDADQTIWFYRDVLGLADPTGIVVEERPGSGASDPYLHVFFRMGNGEYIAFFDAPSSAEGDWFLPKDGFDMHFAFEVASEEELEAMKVRLQDSGFPVGGPLDHGFVRSIYTYDPNGIQIELTRRVDSHDEILAHEQSSFEETLATWRKRTRSQKLEKFGAEALTYPGGDG
ncbi:hypothetical protein B5C34_15705 [Pacificimonas flava]|uniref:VOC domain-containing protein n=2 Tax=Pacificimonas TaxID=1960290 RepID=A0A219B0T0_9SPHN|nr:MULTISPECIES: VOC family protein [Pacificimonas]MBZ6379589.1 VOC family protein [Pacificimonas aurantium]OWV31937.1 hypothetical protein B5C34_15705 [Pacificimonas flava]